MLSRGARGATATKDRFPTPSFGISWRVGVFFNIFWRSGLGKYSREQRYQLRRLGQGDDIVIFNLGRDGSNRFLALGAVVRPYALGRTDLRALLGLIRHDGVVVADIG